MLLKTRCLLLPIGTAALVDLCKLSANCSNHGELLADPLSRDQPTEKAEDRSSYTVCATRAAVDNILSLKKFGRQVVRPTWAPHAPGLLTNYSHFVLNLVSSRRSMPFPFSFFGTTQILTLNHHLPLTVSHLSLFSSGYRLDRWLVVQTFQLEGQHSHSSRWNCRCDFRNLEDQRSKRGMFPARPIAERLGFDSKWTQVQMLMDLVT